MAERIVQEESLVAVADAIRAKGGTSDALSFPTGFAEAISAIQAGGGGGGAVTSGTVTALESSVHTIQHNLGVVPSVLFWYTEGFIENGTPSDPKLFSPSYKLKAPYASSSDSMLKSPFLAITKDYIIRLGYNSWGNMELIKLDEVVMNSTDQIVFDENILTIMGGDNGTIPYSEDGTVKVHWFAIA